MTVLVGANNSGKTAALSALRLFLRDRKEFNPYDIGAENWSTLQELGETWAALPGVQKESESFVEAFPWQEQLNALNDSMPFVDVWLDVRPGSFHVVAHLIPSLGWTEGLLGVRLRLEPAEDISALQRLAWSFRQARLLAQAATEQEETAQHRVWPTDLLDYWLRQAEPLGTIAAYKLDPEKIVPPDQRQRARPQALPTSAARFSENVLANVVRLDLIPAQRGLGTIESGGRSDRAAVPGLFSRQLVQLAERRFDRAPYDQDAQQAMHAAIASAQARLDQAIADALKDVTANVRILGYPGLHDPQELVFRSRVRAGELLNHSTAVQYSVDESPGRVIQLPEHGIGLGYQNLQALTYKLYSFREERLGGASAEPDTMPVPVHIVLVEEPEAHLHVQAQRVFVTRAYKLLSQDASDGQFSTQLMISTHSSHVAHAVPLAKLRYFRRAAPECGTVPSSAVVPLNDMFGGDEETQRFAERYLRVQHSDLLFADAAIFVEGTAERLLVPQFVERDWGELSKRYISYLEVGGSHAHRLRPLIERLGLPALVITDLDPAEEAVGSDSKVKFIRKPADPTRSQVTMNPTLTAWHPAERSVSQLLALTPEEMEAQIAGWPGVGFRVAYQVPSGANQPCGTSFEDAFVLENESFFLQLKKGVGPVEKMRLAVKRCNDRAALSNKLHQILGKRFDKGQFALDLLTKMQADAPVVCPRYIADGLKWLDAQLAPPSIARVDSEASRSAA